MRGRYRTLLAVPCRLSIIGRAALGVQRTQPALNQRKSSSRPQPVCVCFIFPERSVKGGCPEFRYRAGPNLHLCQPLPPRSGGRFACRPRKVTLTLVVFQLVTRLTSLDPGEGDVWQCMTYISLVFPGVADEMMLGRVMCLCRVCRAGEFNRTS